jgi:hypothetical protein
LASLFETQLAGVFLQWRLPGRMLNVSKLGDSKPCIVCGGVTTLRIVQPSLATLGWIDESSIPYDISPLPMWQCDDCDERQLADAEVEA